MSGRPILLQRGLLIDGGSPRPIGLVDVLVRGDTIVQVSADPLEAKDAQIVALGGCALLPGLIDAHVHANVVDDDLATLGNRPASYTALRAAQGLQAMLRRGFTSVRDAAGADWGLKQAVAEGVIEGPRLFISGHAISQTGGHGDYRRRGDTRRPDCHCATALASIARVADGADAMRVAVREELRQSADQIKIFASGGLSGINDRPDVHEFSEDELRIAVATAAERGSYVMAHAYGAGAIRRAIRAGVRSIEHGNMIDGEVAALAAEHGTVVVPTLSAYWLPGHVRATLGADQARAYDGMLAAGLDAVRACAAADVALGFGTDLFGSLQAEQAREFILRRQVQPAHEIIASATRVNARLLGMEGRLGVIAPGAIADAIAVVGDPLSDIALLGRPEHIRLIMQGGKIKAPDRGATPEITGGIPQG